MSTPICQLEERVNQAYVEEAKAARKLLDAAGLSTDQARRGGVVIDVAYQVNVYQYEVARKLTAAAEEELAAEQERLRSRAEPAAR